MKTKLEYSLPQLPYGFNPNVREQWIAVAYTKARKSDGKRRIVRWMRKDLTSKSQFLGNDKAFVVWTISAKERIKRKNLKSIQGFAFFKDHKLQYIDGPL